MSTSTNASEVATGGYHSCVLDSAGAASCWGGNSFGELGTGSFLGPQTCNGADCSRVPVSVKGGIAFASIDAGEDHTCGVSTSGKGYCWGLATYGRIGLGDTGEWCAVATCLTYPIEVAGQLKWQTISAGALSSCGVTVSGAGYCWGAANGGQLGIGTDAAPNYCGGQGIGQDLPCAIVPIAVAGGIQFKTIEAGISHTCGISEAGRLYCWGAGYQGQLGDGAGISRNAPAEVSMP